MERKAVKIYTAPDNLQAEMILEVFGKNGIPGYKRDLGAAGIMNLYSGNSTFGEEIFVAEEDVPKAVELLEGMGLEAEPETSSGDESDLRPDFPASAAGYKKGGLSRTDMSGADPFCQIKNSGIPDVRTGS